MYDPEVATILRDALDIFKRIFDKKPIDYRTLTSQDNPRALDEEVALLLADGWVLSGDAKLGKCWRSGEPIYIQSMVKYGEAK
ncbi:MAG: DUF1737 domain-containing protein [Gammaproteobacteria bacterium]|nr:DUF1737 domain-containing protein [Gammaproteobacteria bacterium]